MDRHESQFVVETREAPAPGGAYAQGRMANGFLFTAGFGGFDPLSGNLVGTTVREQTGQALRNIEAVLAASGLSLGDVIKVNAYLQEPLRDFAEFNSVYQETFRPPYPVRTTVGCSLLNMLVEIDVVATKSVPNSANEVQN
jgi:2-iminobutanoate/2-iminopropanoate deaminase